MLGRLAPLGLDGPRCFLDELGSFRHAAADSTTSDTAPTR